MSLIYCPFCQTVEGPTRGPTDQERIHLDIENEDVTLCAECGEEVEYIPEHDDSEMER